MFWTLHQGDVVSITSQDFQPTLHCPCSWTSLRKPYLVPVNGQSQFLGWLMSLVNEALTLLQSASLCTAGTESNLHLTVLHCSTELQGSGGGRALSLGQVMELTPRALAHSNVQPQHTGVHKGTLLNPSELPASLASVHVGGVAGWVGAAGLGAAGGLELQVPPGSCRWLQGAGGGCRLQLGTISSSSCITDGKEDKQWRGNEIISRDGGSTGRSSHSKEESVVMAKQSDSLILWFLLG